MKLLQLCAVIARVYSIHVFLYEYKHLIYTRTYTRQEVAWRRKSNIFVVYFCLAYYHAHSQHVFTNLAEVEGYGRTTS